MSCVWCYGCVSRVSGVACRLPRVVSDRKLLKRSKLLKKFMGRFSVSHNDTAPFCFRVCWSRTRLGLSCKTPFFFFRVFLVPASCWTGLPLDFGIFRRHECSTSVDHIAPPDIQNTQQPPWPQQFIGQVGATISISSRPSGRAFVFDVVAILREPTRRDTAGIPQAVTAHRGLPARQQLAPATRVLRCPSVRKAVVILAAAVCHRET